MNNRLNDNFADYEAPGRAPLRYEVRRGREEAERRGEVFLEPPATRNLVGDVESWWAELRPEERLAEVANLWQPEMFAAGVVARGGSRFYSYLTKILEEASVRGEVGGYKFGAQAIGGHYRRMLEKLGVSKDELKYTGLGDFLRARETKAVPLEDVVNLARSNELRMKVRELAFEEARRDELDRYKDGQDKMLNKAADFRKDFRFDLAEAAEKGQQTLYRKEMELYKQQPSHYEGYYQGGYVLPDKTGGIPKGYRERLYEPNKPEGVDVEFTHRASYPRAFAHSRGEERTLLVPRKTIFGNLDYDEVPGYMVEELQSDTHQRVAGYLTGDPMRDAPLIIEEGAKRLASEYHPHIFEWDLELPAKAHIRIFKDERGYNTRIYGEKLNGEVVDTEEVFKNIRSLKDKLPEFVRSEGLDPEPMLENWKGLLTEGDTRLAADYPFKKDWWKVQVKDWLKLAVEDPKAKALGLPSGEMMAERVGFKIKEGIPELRGQFAWDLYEKKVPKFIEEEFGVKVQKGLTESKDALGLREVPVWIVPIEEIREKLLKPQRLSFLTKSQEEFA